MTALKLSLGLVFDHKKINNNKKKRKKKKKKQETSNKRFQLNGLVTSAEPLSLSISISVSVCLSLCLSVSVCLSLFHSTPHSPFEKNTIGRLFPLTELRSGDQNHTSPFLPHTPIIFLSVPHFLSSIKFTD